MYDELKKAVYDANMALPAHGLVTLTWGNVSGVDRDAGIMAIKPSGVEYSQMKPEDMVIVRLSDGEVIDSKLKPSSDTPTHLVLYRNFPEIGGVCHTHSRFATIFSQLGVGIPPLGTTHADYFYGEIPCTSAMTAIQIENDYEANTGEVIVNAFKERDCNSVPAVLVCEHGPFTWGNSAAKAVENAVVLEEVAFMAWHTLMLESPTGIFNNKMDQKLLDKHFLRKHGKNAYYGQ
ncbi:MAG: L-ribulose-5-phosphate 4-epimerase [Ruminococcus sp.]|jgi:L-ribulose-5-phosphate 4-epimerase|nr:L-ribulose-5-phosphate 4-epimerase [Ruminococcus sp.]